MCMPKDMAPPNMSSQAGIVSAPAIPEKIGLPLKNEIATNMQTPNTNPFMPNSRKSDWACACFRRFERLAIL